MADLNVRVIVLMSASLVERLDQARWVLHAESRGDCIRMAVEAGLKVLLPDLPPTNKKPATDET